MTRTSQTPMVALTIDDTPIEVPRGTLVIRAAEMLGITIPRFCDHPLLDPIGACRQCMVEVEGKPGPMTSCTTPCAPGMVVRTHLTSDLASDAQEAQLEFLLINHPLDCPQCDKGGECPLQDQTLAHGPPDSRFIDSKRRYRKPIPISSLVALDRERCVLCARCTRFSTQISGDPFIELFERGALEQVAIYEDEPYHSYFSGNVVQICPVGALTATSYRFHARPFDVRSHDGVCNQCSAGCALRVDVRNGEVQRQLAGENPAVNEMWNCDRGRFAFEYVAHDDRLRRPAARDELGELRPLPWRRALGRAADGLGRALEAGGPGAVGVLTGGRLTDEDAYAVGRYARDVLGTDNVDFRLRPRTDERAVLAAVAGTVGPTYDEVERSDLVVVAGLDTEEEVPILHLRLRKAWRQRRQRIVVVGPVLGSLAEIAWRWVRTDAGDEARVLGALAAADAGERAPALAEVVDALRDAGVTAVVLAGERLALSPGALPAAAELARARGIGFAWVPRRNGARGAVDAGLLPGLLPGGRALDDPGPVADVFGRLPERAGLDSRGMLEAAAAGRLTALHLIGVDPARDFEDPALARAALERVDTLIVQDLLPTASARHADVVLPAAASQERVGSFTTWEGRRQAFPQAVPRQGDATEDWDVLRQLAVAMGTDLGWETAWDVRREAAPLMGVPVRSTERLPRLEPARPPRRAERDGDFPYRAVCVDYLMGDATMLLGAKELASTARAPSVWVNPEDAAGAGLAAGSTAEVVGPGGSLSLPVRLREGVARGCVVLPGNAEQERVAALAERRGTEASVPVRLEAVDAPPEGADALPRERPGTPRGGSDQPDVVEAGARREEG